MRGLWSSCTRGTVKAFSPGPGQGSEFVVRLPGVYVPPKSEPNKLAGSVKQAVLPKRKILIVEDNLEFSRSMSVLLRSWGQEVRAAADGPTALEAVHSLVPDVVLMDIGLPGMDGYEIARRLRQQPESRDVFMDLH